MSKLFIILLCLLVPGAYSNCFRSEVLNPKPKDEAAAAEGIKKQVGKVQGNFLVVRNLEAAIMSTRSLVNNMNNIQKNVMFDDNNGPKGLDQLAEMMKESMDMKVRFESTVGEIMGTLTTIDTSVQAVAMCNAPGSKCKKKASDMVSLAPAGGKIKDLKRMLDKEVDSAADQFGEFLKTWSGGDVLDLLQKEIEKKDAAVLDEEKTVEKMSKAYMDARMEEADNEGDAVEASRMISWFKNQEYKNDREAAFNKGMQAWKMAMDSRPSFSFFGISAGPRSPPAPMPERPPAELLKANEIGQGLAKYQKQLAAADAKVRVLKKKIQDSRAKQIKAEAKLAKIEGERRALDQKLKDSMQKMGGVSVEHVKAMSDAVTSFFHQKKNVMALSTSIASFDQFIKGWQDHWDNYDKMQAKTKILYIECLLDQPMTWGVVAPEVWTSVQVFPSLLKKVSGDGLKQLDSEDDAGQVKTFRDSLKEVFEANAEMTKMHQDL